MKNNKPPETEKMREGFSKQATQVKTGIWQEVPSEDNPFVAESVRCHGYPLEDLITGRSFIDMFYLLFQGELPEPGQAKLLEQLMIAMINPGPRDPATRAAVITTATKTMHGNTLPIGLTTFGGSKHGAGETRLAMRFIKNAMAETQLPPTDASEVPGFGSSYNSRDIVASRMLEILAQCEAADSALLWAMGFNKTLSGTAEGILPSGVVAAALLDLGFTEQQGTALYQLIAAPGIAAHALEYMNAGPNDLPFPSDEHVIYAE